MRSDMHEWTEIRRKVLVEGTSKRSVMAEYGLACLAIAAGLVVARRVLASGDRPSGGVGGS